MQTRNVYCISGLYADWRLFAKIVLPEAYRMVHVNRVPPAGNETISSLLAEKLNSF